MSKYYYAVLEHDPDLKEREGPIETFLDLEFSATECAENFFNHRNGWEATWPLTFVLFDVVDVELGRFYVEIEVTPDFRARRVKK